MIHDSGLVARAGFRAPQDADCMALMRTAGAIPLVVTNVPELAMYWESYNNVHGCTSNPYDTRRICGGSSGGEGSLIASAGSVIGIGTDIGGSIRMPAFFNGIFGHKPTTGLVSNKGQYPPARDASLDFCLVAGPMCRYADDLSPMLRVMAAKNISSIKLDEPTDFRRLKIFYMIDDGGSYLVTPVCREMKAAVKKVVRHFADTYDCPITDPGLGSYFKYSMQIFNARLAGADVPSFAAELSLLKGEIDVIPELFRWVVGRSPHTLPALGLCLLERVAPQKGSSALKHFLNKAVTLRTKLCELLGEDGVFIYPSHPEPAPFHYQTIFKPFNYAYTAIFNVLGFPVTQCPTGLSSAGLPLGVQVVGNMYKDHLCLAVAKEIERAFGGWVSPSALETTAMLNGK
uniref:Putative amidase n=2 Tax=Ornithodoros turicata TaxID=34597 RepID=A0A2R5L8J4_9ACAR